MDMAVYKYQDIVQNTLLTNYLKIKILSNKIINKLYKKHLKNSINYLIANKDKHS